MPANKTVLIIHDPDAPVAGGYTHWILYNLATSTAVIAVNSVPALAQQGLNGSGRAAHTAPCPPSGTHHYYFYLYALDQDLSFAQPPGYSELQQAIVGHVLDQVQLIGLFLAN